MTSKLPHPDETTRPLQDLLEQAIQQNEQLKAQLMNSSLVNELTRVLQSCADLEGITKTVLLGIQEIIGFDRAVLFGIDKTNFCITAQSWVGIDEASARKIRIPLGFEGGDIIDAIFLNRHIVVDEPDGELDPFSLHLESRRYLVMPLVSKALKRCYDIKNCTVTSCSAHGGHNPYCWSIRDSGSHKHQISEDEKRRECIACKCFKCEGVLWMDKAHSGGPITSDNITMLSAIINVAGLIIENHRIFNALEIANRELLQTNKRLKEVNRDLQIAQAKINADLERARKVQFGLLPQDIPHTAALSVATRYIPATAVGGDYYDVFEIEPGIYGIVVADVSGHGISSALIMAMAKILLKTYAAGERSPQKTLEAINRTFLAEIKSDNFVTIFYAVLDTTVSTITYTSAGHCPILIINKENNTCRQIKADGLFLGVFEDMMLGETHYEYIPQQTRVVLYTDGLTEERNANDEMFDVSRLKEISLATTALPPRDAVDKILACQRTFCGKDREPEDDITILIVDF